MIPIYEQGRGKGIGHNLQSFQERFGEICTAHLAGGKAKFIAFLFYDFDDREIRRIIKDQGVFAKLDRLTGTELSLFYLHVASEAAIKSFNEHFLTVLGLDGKVSLPCVVFFRVKDGEIDDVEIAQLESADLIHGFHELYVSIESYLKSQPAASVSGSRAIRWFRSGFKILSVEVFRAALRRWLDGIL